MGKANDIDDSLVVHVASLSHGSQRWLKTAIQAIRTSELPPPLVSDEREAPATPASQTDPHERPVTPIREPEEHEEPAEREPPSAKPGASLEDVITGKADLREQLESYPELSNELEGLADVIDLLREAGERRRKRGADILRELLEGTEGEESEEERDGA